MAPLFQHARPAAVLLSALLLAACAGCDGNASLQATADKPAADGGKADETKKEPERVPVTIAGKTFKLEPALDDATRMKGLGGRTEIEADGGMIFVFPQAAVRHFVMRDCPVPIDIMFLDGAGRVLVTHAMVPEEPRRPDEPKPTEPYERDPYEARLHQYSSRFPTAIAIELKGGTIKELGVKPGDKIELDIESLKKRAR